LWHNPQHGPTTHVEAPSAAAASLSIFNLFYYNSPPFRRPDK